jgi:hypothetical protein
MGRQRSTEKKKQTNRWRGRQPLAWGSAMSLLIPACQVPPRVRLVEPAPSSQFIVFVLVPTAAAWKAPAAINLRLPTIVMAGCLNPRSTISSSHVHDAGHFNI